MGDEENDGKRLSGAEESAKKEAEGQKRVSTEEEVNKEGKRRSSSVGKSATRIKSSKSLGALNRTAPSRASLSRMKMRKYSYGFGGVAGIRPVENVQVPPEFRRPQLVYLPTYQLEPSVRFHVAKVTAATNESLDELFEGHKYNEQETPALSMKIAGEVMRKVKAMQFNRYRVITVVTIGQKRAQSYCNAITFLWDHERDNYVNLQRENTWAFIQITTFGIYLD